MARNAQRTADPAPQDTDTATAEHSVHGLVAITDGPDYCLCGSTWPCPRRPEQGAQP